MDTQLFQNIINCQNGDYPYLIFIKEESIEQITETQKQDQHNLYFYLDGIKMKKEKGVYREFSRVLNFPNYFGKNWNALNDSLKMVYLELGMKCPNGELFADNPNANVVLVLKNFRYLLVDGWDLEYTIILEIINDMGDKFALEPPITRGEKFHRGFHTFLVNDRQLEITEKFKTIKL